MDPYRRSYRPRVPAAAARGYDLLSPGSEPGRRAKRLLERRLHPGRAAPERRELRARVRAVDRNRRPAHARCRTVPPHGDLCGRTGTARADRSYRGLSLGSRPGHADRLRQCRPRESVVASRTRAEQRRQVCRTGHPRRTGREFLCRRSPLRADPLRGFSSGPDGIGFRSGQGLARKRPRRAEPLSDELRGRLAALRTLRGRQRPGRRAALPAGRLSGGRAVRDRHDGRGRTAVVHVLRQRRAERSLPADERFRGARHLLRLRCLRPAAGRAASESLGDARVADRSARHVLGDRRRSDLPLPLRPPGPSRRSQASRGSGSTLSVRRYGPSRFFTGRRAATLGRMVLFDSRRAGPRGSSRNLQDARRIEPCAKPA